MKPETIQQQGRVTSAACADSRCPMGALALRTICHLRNATDLLGVREAYRQGQGFGAECVGAAVLAYARRPCGERLRSSK